MAGKREGDRDGGKRVMRKKLEEGERRGGGGGRCLIAKVKGSKVGREGGDYEPRSGTSG